MKNTLLYKKNLRIFFHPWLLALAIGFKKHEHFRDIYPFYSDGSSWKLCLCVACFEVHIMLWKAKDED
jgi:hypothetical protein